MLQIEIQIRNVVYTPQKNCPVIHRAFDVIGRETPSAGLELYLEPKPKPMHNTAHTPACSSVLLCVCRIVFPPLVQVRV